MIRMGQLLLLSLLLACKPQSSKDSQASPSPDQRKTEDSITQNRASGKGSSSIHCFAYHRFGNSSYPSTNISLDKFEAHLRFLKKNDYTVLTLGKALKQMRSGRSSDNTAVLTMDDAYKSIMTGALPLLEEYGYKATIFACTEYVGGKNNLSWKDLKTLKKKGFEIGDHSHSHAHFLNASDNALKAEFREDLERSRSRFKEHLGTVPDLYAYPYGEYVPTMQETLKELGYKAAVAQRSGVVHRGADQYALPRFPMTSFYGKAEKFRKKARMGALRVVGEKPSSPVVSSDDPPKVRFRIEDPNIQTNKLQCFVDGDPQCDLTTKKTKKGLVVRVKSRKKLKDRRTLYTITAPGADGDWHWHSKLWVRPEKPE